MERTPKFYKGKSMDIAFFAMIFIVMVLLVVAYMRDPSLPLAGINSAFRTLIAILPLLLVSFVLSGLIRVLIPDEVIIRWFGTDAGVRSLLIASGAGMLTPGGPFVCFPIALMLFKSGAGIGPVVSYVTAWATLGLFRIPLEMSIIGPKFAIIRFVTMLFVAPLAGYVVNLIINKVR
jgi:uncharacterized membrane protein YraQ (UPF0718 family)